jgi:hypothetical protein
MDGRRRTDTNRAGHRTRLTGRPPGIARLAPDARRRRSSPNAHGVCTDADPPQGSRHDAHRETHRGGPAASNPASCTPHVHLATGDARQAYRSVFVFAPDRACRAGVADEPGLVHPAQGERVVAPAEQAVNLDTGTLARRKDRYETDGAAPNPPGASHRSARFLVTVDGIEGHGLGSLRGHVVTVPVNRLGPPAALPQWRVRTIAAADRIVAAGGPAALDSNGRFARRR